MNYFIYLFTMIDVRLVLPECVGSLSSRNDFRCSFAGVSWSHTVAFLSYSMDSESCLNGCSDYVVVECQVFFHRLESFITLKGGVISPIFLKRKLRQFCGLHLGLHSWDSNAGLSDHKQGPSCHEDACPGWVASFVLAAGQLIEIQPVTSKLTVW